MATATQPTKVQGVRLPVELIKQLDRIATETGRTRNDLINVAVHNYLTYQQPA